MMADLSITIGADPLSAADVNTWRGVEEGRRGACAMTTSSRTRRSTDVFFSQSSPYDEGSRSLE